MQYINCSKSACLRIGCRFKVPVSELSVLGVYIPWNQELKQLGISFTWGTKFTPNMQGSKQKYFRALNAIFGKIGLNGSPVVLCFLVQTFCVSILLYGAESVIWSRKVLDSVEHAYSLAFMKIFRTFDNEIIKYCQQAMGYLPLRLLLDMRKLIHFSKLYNLRADPF